MKHCKLVFKLVINSAQGIYDPQLMFSGGKKSFTGEVELWWNALDRVVWL